MVDMSHIGLIFVECFRIYGNNGFYIYILKT